MWWEIPAKPQFSGHPSICHQGGTKEEAIEGAKKAVVHTKHVYDWDKARPVEWFGFVGGRRSRVASQGADKGGEESPAQAGGGVQEGSQRGLEAPQAPAGADPA